MYTALQIITESMHDLGVLRAGGSPTADQETLGLRRLNMMINRWSVRRLMVYAITSENFALAINTASYTYGANATWNSSRPTKILSPAYIRDENGRDYPVTVIGPEQYARIHDKDLAGRPSKMLFNPTFPNAVCTVYPVPTAAENIYINALKPFSELGSNAANCSFPGEYEEALRTNLDLRLAPVFGKTVTQEIKDLAQSSLDDIEIYNASLQVESVSSDPLRRNYTYDIRED